MICVTQNNIPASLIGYVDMNSFFASCEQQDFPELRGKPIGVITYNSPNACVIAPSIEAKKFGVKTGMRLSDCQRLCPHIIPVTTRPPRYRNIHLGIMNVLKKYCEEIKAKSIDEATMNLSSYKWIYKDMEALVKSIKADITEQYDYLKCSIGIAPNTFLAKLGTELQKPDGFIHITPENIDCYLGQLKLQDLPGIAKNNARKLELSGIRTPLQMRYTSPALLRKAFGGIVGDYWHRRLNFKEVDAYDNSFHAMSAMRTVSPVQRESQQTLESLLIALCTRLEQRMVKQNLFCKEVSFFIRYKNHTGWDTRIRFTQPLQDAIDIRNYIKNRMNEFETTHGIATMLHNQVQSMGVGIQNFIKEKYVTYNLFENKMREDRLRKVMYNIKDQYGRNSVRKATEIIEPHVMKDAIGFGSVRDMADNKYLLEEE